MTQADTMRIIADAMEGKCKIELLFNSRETYTGFDTRSLLGEMGVWKKLTWDEKERTWYIGDGHCASISLWEILYKKMEIRIAKLLPLLSDADADFAEKYLPHDWWITKDEGQPTYIELHNVKPTKDVDIWIPKADSKQLVISLVANFPTFSEVKWEDSDCYTIQELLDNYKENKR